MTSIYQTGSGSEIRLSGKVGSGGEGAVHEVVGQQNVVAKIYHAPMDSGRSQKIAAMCGLQTGALATFAAWPSDVVLDKSGRTVGFIMPKIAGTEDIHSLYSPKSRRSEFPDADFRFIVRAAANLSRAFAAVHETGCVVGDVNHGSVLVSRRATVTLIDCDSFQVTSAGKLFHCNVGVPLFTAPELQGKPFRGLVRDKNHDLFGMAVLIFHLLFMGRHPFAGRFLGSGDMPIERAIREYRFAFGSNRKNFQMEPPPHSVPLAAMAARITDLFEQSFATDSHKTNARPGATAWISALTELEKELIVCKATGSHHYHKKLHSCPWCRIENSTGVPLFGFLVATTQTSTFDLSRIWSTIENASLSTARPLLPSHDSYSFAAPAELDEIDGELWALRALSIAVAIGGLIATAAQVGGGALVLISMGIAYWIWPNRPSKHSAKYSAALSVANKAFDDAMDRWEAAVEAPQFAAFKKELESARAGLANLSATRGAKLRALEKNAENLQRTAFLDRFLISKAKIKGIGSGRVSMLESYGVETAADVNPNVVRNVPGFGDALTKTMLDWRNSVAANFRFDPSKGVDPALKANIEKEVLSLKQKYEVQLRKGAAEVGRVREMAEAQRRLAWENVLAAHKRRAEAEFFLSKV